MKLLTAVLILLTLTTSAQAVRVVVFDIDGGHALSMRDVIWRECPSAAVLVINVGRNFEMFAQAVDSAIEFKADIINISLVGYNFEAVHAAVKKATALGIIIVAPVKGNANSFLDAIDPNKRLRRYPGAYPEVLGVYADDPRGRSYATAITAGCIANVIEQSGYGNNLQGDSQ